MNANYAKGRSYTYAINRYLYRDILHDAFEKWFNKTGKNLFEEPHRLMIRVIKLTYYGYYINQRIRGRQFYEFEDNQFNSVTPEEELIASDSSDWLVNEIRERYPKSIDNIIEMLNMKHQGYEQKEIAAKQGVNKTQITYYLNNVKSIMNNHPDSPFLTKNYNPFVANKLVVSKPGISSKVFNNNPKYKDYVKDGYCQNEEFEVWVKGDDAVLVKLKK